MSDPSDDINPIDLFNKIVDLINDLDDSSGAYEADNEQPRVFCSYGTTPAMALYNMGDIIALNGIESWTASAVNIDEDGVCHLTIYTRG